MIAQHHRIRQRPKRHCVFNQTRHAVKVRDIAQRDHQMIVFELELAGTETGADGYDLSFQIYVLDLPHDQVAARAKAPNWRNDIGQADRPGDHFRQHRLVDPIVLAIDQGDGSLVGAEELRQVARGVNAREAAAEDQDLLWAFAHGRPGRVSCEVDRPTGSQPAAAWRVAAEVSNAAPSIGEPKQAAATTRQTSQAPITSRRSTKKAGG